jgi:hypothetical protein
MTNHRLAESISRFASRLRVRRARPLRPGVPYGAVRFVPKKQPGDETPWVAFGSTREEYDKWIPEVCGVCCLKMAVDTFTSAPEASLYDLTMRCLAKGGFRENDDGTIDGVFHYPLVALAEELGLKGLVERRLSLEQVREYLAENRMVVLSIDLARVSPSRTGGHLILVHRYLPETSAFLVNDCSFAVGESGADVSLPSAELARIATGRGIALWKE